MHIVLLPYLFVLSKCSWFLWERGGGAFNKFPCLENEIYSEKSRKIAFTFARNSLLSSVIYGWYEGFFLHVPFGYCTTTIPWYVETYGSFLPLSLTLLWRFPQFQMNSNCSAVRLRATAILALFFGYWEQGFQLQFSFQTYSLWKCPKKLIFTKKPLVLIFS